MSADMNYTPPAHDPWEMRAAYVERHLMFSFELLKAVLVFDATHPGVFSHCDIGQRIGELMDTMVENAEHHEAADAECVRREFEGIVKESLA